MKKGIALLLALVATAVVAASAQGTTGLRRPRRRQLQEHAEDPVRDAAHRRRRLPRHGADELGEVCGQDARASARAEDQHRPRRHAGRAGRAPAQALAQKFVGDKSVVAILGPSTSGAVAASTQTYFQAGIAHLSPSATRTDLTKRHAGVKETPAFLRDVPGDYIQGPRTRTT